MEVENFKSNRRVSYRTFLAHARKSDVPFFVYIYHSITYPVSFLFFKAGLSANTVSILGILLSLIGGALLFGLKMGLGLSLLLVSYLLDFCDGNIARVDYGYLRKPRSESSRKMGMLLESLYANVSYFFFFIGLGYYFFITTTEPFYLLLGVFAYGMKIITRYSALHICLLNKQAVQNNGCKQKEVNIFSSSLLNKIKYFFVRIVDNARMYYLSFLIIFAVLPSFLPQFFIGYTLFVFFLNLIKLNLILIRKLP